MTHSWSHRIALALAAGACTLLASCGGGSVVSNLNANRAITVGDGFEDVGQGPTGMEFTVNDGSGNWVQSFVSNYNLTMTPADQGGWGYAQGYAQVATEATDPNGNKVPSVSDQIDALLARTTLTQHDIVMINGGMSDIVAAVEATGASSAATTNTVKAAADALANQVQRLVNAGATHVVVTGVYDLGMTPWAAQYGGFGGPISTLSGAFNNELLLQLNHFSSMSPNPVLFFGAAEFFDFAYNSVAQGTTSNGNFSLTNITTPVCTTPTAATCTPTTTISPTNYNAYMFADNLYLTPNVQRLFVNTGYAQNALSLFQNVWGS